MNDDFEVEVVPEVKPKSKRSSKPAVSAKKKAMIAEILASTDEELDAPAGVVQIDETTKKVRIIIDEMAGCKENFEAVGVNGVVYLIKRGVPVEVPQEVVHVLGLAVTTHIEQKQNPMTGELEEVKRNFSAIPWRRA